MKNILYFILAFSFIIFSSCENTSKESKPKPDMEKQYIFVGTYTKKEGHVDGKGKGIHLLEFDAESAKNGKKAMTSITAFETINPSFVAISPDKKMLYAVNELGPNDGDAGIINSYTIDPTTKKLQFVNSQKTDAFAPCHVIVDETGKYLFVANYVGGIVKVFPIKADGSIKESTQTIQVTGKSVNASRQESSHPHSVIISLNNKHTYVPDLGTDKIMIYELDLKNGKMNPTKQGFAKVQDGAGPRHFTFHPNEKFAYVINELDATVNAFSYDTSTGELSDIQSITTLPNDYEGFNGCADIHIHPSGKYLYASNRGHDSIVIYKIDNSTGKLALIGHESTRGEFPRNFTIDPSGDFLLVANQNTDDIYLFKIDLSTGKLQYQEKIEVPTPVCLKFL